KAQARGHAAQPYADGITEVVRSLQAASSGSSNPLLTPREEVRNVAQVVFSADRGLCGGYNTSVIRAAEGQKQLYEAQGKGTSLVTVGRKAESSFRFRDEAIDASFGGFTDAPTYEDARAIAASVASRFESGELDLV